MSRCRAHARREGFSLLELLIVMVIVAIVVMMAAPSIGSGLRQTHAQQAAATIAQDLERGLGLAARTHRPVVFRLNTDSMVYHLVDRVNGQVFATQHMAPGRSEFGLSSMVASGTTVDLLPNGTVGAATLPFTLVIQAGDNRRRIKMTRAGLILVEGA